MSEPLLAVEDLYGYYGRAEILHGVSLTVGETPVAVVGRNGMGKSTLCKALVGLLSRVHGSVRLEGNEIMGRKPNEIAAAGLGYVPQGRRVFPSLTVDEHLAMMGSRRGKRMTAEGIYELFPRLAERRKQRAEHLSGGEQQMLAISRALLGEPKLLILDEPSEGLAPTIVTKLVETTGSLAAEGMGILLIEQNLGVATQVCDRVLTMVNGEITQETSAKALLADPEAQRRLIGVDAVEAGGPL